MGLLSIQVIQAGQKTVGFCSFVAYFSQQFFASE